MPITRRQFDLGINDTIDVWMRKTYELVARHRDQAFSADEIARRLGAENDAARDELEVGLRALVTVTAIQNRLVDDDSYYAFWHEMNTETWEEKVAGLAR